MPTILQYGLRGLLVELTSVDEVRQFAAAVDAARSSGKLPHVLEVTPAARTLLVICRDERGALQQTADRLDELTVVNVDILAGPQVELPIIYDGPDLTAIATELGIDTDEVIRRHTFRPWTVAFTGFSPGFGYLVGGHPGLRVRRRAEPRTGVAAGSVGLAGEFSCVYPRESPGGWRLIGHTSISLFDPTRQEPALLRPGMSVNFVRATV